MSDAALKQMTPDEFILWNLEQEERWEFVDGRPVLKFNNGPEMMAGASESHDQIVVNLIQALRRLRGGPCRAKTADQAARMEGGNIRYPDVTIDCGVRAPASLESLEPTVFFEVLSPSTRRFDLLRKTDEYRRVRTLRHLVLIEPHQAKVMLWSRDAGEDWSTEEIAGLDGEIALTAIGVSLPRAEVYEDVELSETPQLE